MTRMRIRTAGAYTPLDRALGLWRVVVVLAMGTALGAVGCSQAQPQTVSLRLHGDVPNAAVTIDERPIGWLAYVAEKGVALPPGRHRIAVERQGYFPFDAMVDVKEGDPPLQLNVQLVPIPD